MASNTSIPTELGTENIGKLLKQYALPAIIAQTASSLYNMVDSIFIGQGVGPLAISGLAITFPLMNLSTAFGTLVGAGAATMLSVLLGQQHYKGANKVLGNVVSLNIIIGLAFMAVSLIFIDPILYFFGASENTLPYAKEYIQIILYGNIIYNVLGMEEYVKYLNLSDPVVLKAVEVLDKGKNRLPMSIIAELYREVGLFGKCIEINAMESRSRDEMEIIAEVQFRAVHGDRKPFVIENSEYYRHNLRLAKRYPCSASDC